jgi:hypothetical protein
MFVQHENLLDHIVSLAAQSGLTDTSGFKRKLESSLSRTDLIKETHLYTEDFFWAYRAKFSLGFSNSNQQNKTSKSNVTASVNKPVTPIPQKVERAATSFVPTYEKKDTNLKIIAAKKIKSELNKLALENYEVIVPRVTTIIQDDVDAIAEFIEIMFGKVQVDIKYLPLYSKMCSQFNDQFLTFKTELLSHCQTELNKPKPEEPELEGDRNSEENLAELEEYSYEVCKWKEKRLASLKFIAELKKSALIEDSVINTILGNLLSHDVICPVSDDISHACELISLVSTAVDRKLIDSHVRRFEEFQKAGNLSTLEQVKIQNAIEVHKKQQNGLEEKKVQKPEVYKPRFGNTENTTRPNNSHNNTRSTSYNTSYNTRELRRGTRK